MEPHIDQLIRTSFPHPVAAAWHRVSLATSSADRIKRLLACVEVLVRVLCVLQLRDYLRGPPDDAVEKTLERLDRPALGHWVQLLRSLLRAIEVRSEPPPFMPEALGWYLAKGRPSDGARKLDELVEVRNDEAHGRVLSVAEQDQRAAELLTQLRAVLSDVAFLAGYRPFRILTASLSRKGGFSGRLQFLVGTAPQPEPVRGNWPARLFEEGVYLTNPSGTAILEVSPFMVVLHDPGPKEDRVFVAAGTQKAKKLVLKNDGTGATESVLVPSDEGDVALDAWLTARAAHRPWQENQGASEHFGVPVRSDAGEVLAGRFEVRDMLGEGGMATVYRVWDQWDEAESALKVLHRELAEDASFKERFRREARTMKRLRHPHILSVEEAGQLEDGRLYLKLPLLSGGTLQDRVRAGATPMPQAVRWAGEMLSALEYLHDKGVVHRDLKPSNFLLDADGNPFLADFGIALQGEDLRLTRTLEQMGSLAYMAPEQRRGGVASPASDVYSLGVVLHELATGREGEVSPGKGVAAPLGALIREMCAEEASDRPTAKAARETLGVGQAPRPPESVGGPPAAPPAAPVAAVKLEAVDVAPGAFAMTPTRQVTLTRPLRVVQPITGALWAAFGGAGDHAPDRPVDQISWFDAIAFCVAASERSGLAPAYRYTDPRPRKAYGIDDMGRMLRDIVPFKRVPAILSHFGKDTLTVMQFHPERLAEVAGIGTKGAAEATAKWDRDKYFVRDVVWDRDAPGYRLPTEAEHAHLLLGDPSDAGLRWVWDADPGPAYQVAATALEPGSFVDPACDEGPRRLACGPGVRRPLLPQHRETGLGLRIVQSG